MRYRWNEDNDCLDVEIPFIEMALLGVPVQGIMEKDDNAMEQFTKTLISHLPLIQFFKESSALYVVVEVENHDTNNPSFMCHITNKSIDVLQDIQETTDEDCEDDDEDYDDEDFEEMYDEYMDEIVDIMDTMSELISQMPQRSLKVQKEKSDYASYEYDSLNDVIKAAKLVKTNPNAMLFKNKDKFILLLPIKQEKRELEHYGRLNYISKAKMMFYKEHSKQMLKGKKVIESLKRL